MVEADRDSRVRGPAFQFLRDQTKLYGDEQRALLVG